MALCPHGCQRHRVTKGRPSHQLLFPRQARQLAVRSFPQLSGSDGCRWARRFLLVQGDVTASEALLRQAFRDCPSSHFQHTRQIFLYWAVARMGHSLRQPAADRFAAVPSIRALQE